MTALRHGNRIVVAALSTAALGYGLTQALVSPLLPTVSRELNVDEVDVAWLVTGFLLTASVAIPIAGRLGDMYGRVRVLRVVLVIFAAGSMLAALAPTFQVLLVARLIQGIGGALFPLAFGIVRERVSLTRLSAAIGLISSMTAVGTGIGIVSVGLLESLIGFHGVFAAAAAFVVAAAALVWLIIPTTGARHGGTLDWLGALLMVVWLSSILIAITQGSRWGWLSPWMLILYTLAALGFTAWVFWEQRVATPIINIRLMLSRPVMYANVLALLFGFLLFAGVYVIPTFVQTPSSNGYGFSASVAKSGLYLLPQTIVFLAVSLLAPAMNRWPGERASVVVGAVVTLIGQVFLAVSHSDPWHVIAALTVTGAGIGLIYTHMAALVVRIVPSAETASASGMNTNIRNIGGTLGVQLSAGILAVASGAIGYSLTFWSFSVIAAIAVPVAILLWCSTRRNLPLVSPRF